MRTLLHHTYVRIGLLLVAVSVMTTVATVALHRAAAAPIDDGGTTCGTYTSPDGGSTPPFVASGAVDPQCGVNVCDGGSPPDCFIGTPTPPLAVVSDRVCSNNANQVCLTDAECGAPNTCDTTSPSAWSVQWIWYTDSPTTGGSVRWTPDEGDDEWRCIYGTTVVLPNNKKCGDFVRLTGDLNENDNTTFHISYKTPLTPNKLYHYGVLGIPCIPNQPGCTANGEPLRSEIRYFRTSYNDYAVSVTPPADSIINSGATSDFYTVTVTPSGGMTGTVSLNVQDWVPAINAATILWEGGTSDVVISGASPVTKRFRIQTTNNAPQGTGTGGNIHTFRVRGNEATMGERFSNNGSLTVQEYQMQGPPATINLFSTGTANTTIGFSWLPGGVPFAESVAYTDNAASIPGLTLTYGTPSPVPAGTAQITVQLNANGVATGIHTITITGTSQPSSMQRSATITINVLAAPDYTISITPPTASIVQGTNATYTVSASPTNGFNEPITVAINQPHASMTVSPSNFVLSGPSYSATVVIGTQASTPCNQSYTVTATGNDTAQAGPPDATRQATASLAVTCLPPPDFSVTLSPSSRNVAQGSSGTYTVTVTSTNGFSEPVALSAGAVDPSITTSFAPTTITPAPNGTATSTLTVNVAGNAPCNQTFPLVVTGDDRAQAGAPDATRNGTANLVVDCFTPPDPFDITATPASQAVDAGDTATFRATVTPLVAYNSQVSIAIRNCPPGATCRIMGANPLNVFAPPSSASTNIDIVTDFAATPAGSYVITFVATGVSDGFVDTVDVTLIVNQPPDFTLSVAVSPLAIEEGQSGTFLVTLQSINGFSNPVTTTWSVSPAAPGISFTPNSGFTITPTGSQTVTVSAAAGSAGTYNVNFTATSGTLVHTLASPFVIIVNPPLCGAGCATGQTCTVTGCQDDPAPGCNESFCFDASGGFKEPATDGCWKSWPRCRDFDVLKVQKTRACEQWLDCQSSVSVENPNTGQLEPQCTELGVCVQLGASGECATFLENGGKTNRVFQSPTDVEGTASKIRWYSGYSSGFHFSDPTTILASYPPTDIGEIGIASSQLELVQNSTFEQLFCQGGARDGESCIVDSECRVGTGLCVQFPENLSAVPGATSSVRCEASQDCTEVTVGSPAVATKQCRYLASWGGDIQCKNPLASEWVGVTPPSDTIDGTLEAGFGATSTEYLAESRWGRRRNANGNDLLRIRVWEDEENFENVQSRFSGEPNATQDPKFTEWAPERHLKDGNNALRVELHAGAAAFTGAGVEVADTTKALETGGEGYMLSFKFRYGVGGGIAETIKAQLALNYTKDPSGLGHETTIGDAVFLDFGEIENATTSWKHYSMGPVIIPSSYDSSLSAFLNFVTKEAATSETIFYLDDVSLKPALEFAKDDEDPTSLVTLPRRCRLYPRDDAPDCDYNDTAGARYRGWRGYCIDKDPANENLCLTWWPLDVLRGEGALGVTPQGYNDRFPLFHCVESDAGPKVVELQFGGVSAVADNLRWQWRPADTGGNNFQYSVDDTAWQYNNPQPRKIYWRDIERIDFMFDPNDDVTTGIPDEQLAWLGCTDTNGDGRRILRKNQFSEDALDSNCGGPGGTGGDDARTWARLDLSKIDRVDSDDGIRLTFGPNGMLNNKNFNTSNPNGGSIWGASGLQDGSWWSGNLGWALLIHFNNINDPNADDAIVDYIRFKAIDGHSTSYMDEVNSGNENVATARIIIRLKSSCNYLMQTVKNENGSPLEKAWASRTRPGSSYVVPYLGIRYQNDSAPFGAVRGGSGEPHLWSDNWTPSGTGIDIGSGMTFREPDTGNELRLGTPYSTRSGATGPVYPGSTEYRYCFDATLPNGNDANVLWGDSDQIGRNYHANNACSSLTLRDTCNGYSNDSACVGPPQPHCSDNPLKPCSQDSDCGSQSGPNPPTCSAGMNNTVFDALGGTVRGYNGGVGLLKRLYAASYGCWKFNASLADADGAAGTAKRIELNWLQDGGTCNQLAWDVLTDGDGGVCRDTDGDGAPGPRDTSDFRIQVDVNGNPVNYFPDQDSYCYVPPAIADLRVGGISTGTMDVRLGQEVTTSFTYVIDAEQLPGRLYGINWNGGACDPEFELPGAASIAVSHRYLDPALVGTSVRPTICLKDNWGAVGSVTSPVTLHIIAQ